MSRDIRSATMVKAPRETVFRAVSTAEGWNSWFTTECELDPVAGGVFLPVWRDFGPDREHQSDVGRVVAIAPPTSITFEWTPVGPRHPTRFTFTLEDDPEGTIVRLVDEGYPDGNDDDVDAIIDCAAAWGEALTLLKFRLEAAHPRTASRAA